MSRLYKDSGVDLRAAETAKARIARSVESTRNALSRGHVGGFGGVVGLPPGLENPNLIMSTDGVGTKVLVAIAAGVHDTIGQDLVNHCVDDILVHGAIPIAFQDYVAAHTLDDEVVAALVEGIAQSCRSHDIVLSGGETAQLPDLYGPGHYDLAGTILGVVEERAAIHGESVAVGDKLVALPSNGLHTNGYTLARRIVFDYMGLDIDDEFPTGRTVAHELLRVHKSYYSELRPRLDRVKGLAHITGGGIAGNLARTVRGDLGAVLDLSSWEVPAVFAVLQEAGDVPRNEMFEVFNMGVGMIAVVAASDVPGFCEGLSEAFVIGDVVDRPGIHLE